MQKIIDEVFELSDKGFHLSKTEVANALIKVLENLPARKMSADTISGNLELKKWVCGDDIQLTIQIIGDKVK